ncbi:MAG: hypothetical protein Q4C68_08480 [Moraxella sp.]|nr:hypothetical protein [Moraxella sp.]
MTYYFNPKTNQYAKVLSVDAGIAIVIINDKRCDMDWQAFLKEFKEFGVSDE